MNLWGKAQALLQRKTNSTSFIAPIDGLRFLAIFMVVFFHINTFVIAKSRVAFSKSPFDYWLLYQAGFTDRKGVFLFFVISGFILAMPFAKYFWQGGAPVRLKGYFLRRLTRLEPPYVITMVLCALALALHSGNEFAASITGSSVSLLHNLGISLLYMHNILLTNVFSVNPVAWSLEIEVQFYVLVPILVLILKLPKLYRRSLLIFLILLFISFQQFYMPGVETLYSYIQYFLLGFLLLDAYLSGWQIKLGSWANFLLGLGCLVFFFYVDLHRQFYFEFIFIAMIFIFYLLVLNGDIWKRFFSLPLITVIGGMCYSIYLLHTTIISAVGNKTVFLSSSNYPLYLAVQAALLLPVILIVTTVFYVLVERPCMDKNWPIKLWLYLKAKFMAVLGKFKKPVASND